MSYDWDREDAIENAGANLERVNKTWQEGRDMLYGYHSAILALQREIAMEERELTSSELLDALAMISHGVCVVFDEISQPTYLERESIREHRNATVAEIDADQAKAERS